MRYGPFRWHNPPSLRPLSSRLTCFQGLSFLLFSSFVCRPNTPTLRADCTRSRSTPRASLCVLNEWRLRSWPKHVHMALAEQLFFIGTHFPSILSFFYILLINFALDKPLQQISDDEDDTHPNVDTPSLFKWRHEARYADLHFYFFFQPGTHFFSPLSNLSTSHSFRFLSPIFCKHLGVRSATIQK